MQGLELILILLAVTAALRLVAERFSIPLPALLVLGGLALAVTPGLARFEIEPDVVFLIFVPPLLYWAALTTSLRDFRRNLRSITLLAVGLVLTTMCIVAWTAHTLIPELTWGSAFVLGAIVSPPDAVAVTAIMRRLGIPRTVTTVLEGESLLNDATAFVAYRMAVAAVVAGTFSFWQAGLRFVWTGIGGIIVGLAVGWLIVRLRRWIGKSPVVENTVSLLTPFAAFIPAEQLGLASVLSVVTTGLYLGREGPKLVSARTRLQAQAMWEILTFLLEGLIFILIGLELPVVLHELKNNSLTTLVRYALVISAVMIAVRMVWMFPGAYLPRYIRRRFGKTDEYPSWREVLFVGWAGIRGGDSLVIALALPLATRSGAPFPGRDLIIFLTFAVILVTLVVQGLSLAGVMRLLNIRADDQTDEKEESQARFKVAQAGLEHLDQIADENKTSSPVVESLREKFKHRLHRLTTNERDAHADGDQQHATDYKRLRLAMIDAERREAIRLRDAETIGDDVMRRIQQDLDFEEMFISDETTDADNAPVEDEAENNVC